MDHRLFGIAQLLRRLVLALLFPFGVGWVVEGWWKGWVVSGTLLGPEGSGVFLPAFFSADLFCWSYRRGL